MNLNFVVSYPTICTYIPTYNVPVLYVKYVDVQTISRSGSYKSKTASFHKSSFRSCARVCTRLRNYKTCLCTCVHCDVNPMAVPYICANLFVRKII